MAGEWIKITHELPEKPEVAHIATIMGYDDTDIVVGKLIRVWTWFDRQTLDGNVANVTFALLDRYAGAPGFTKAMVAAGWLKETKTGFSVINFEAHISESAKQRALAARRKKKHDTQKSNAASVPPSSSSSKSNNSSPKEKKKKVVATIDNIEIPESLAGCREAIQEWITFRADHHKDREPLTVFGLSKSLQQFADIGTKRFVAMVDHTIAHEWKGLREPDDGPANQTPENAAGRGRQAAGGNRRHASRGGSQRSDGFVFDPNAKANNP